MNLELGDIFPKGECDELVQLDQLPDFVLAFYFTLYSNLQSLNNILSVSGSRNTDQPNDSKHIMGCPPDGRPNNHQTLDKAQVKRGREFGTDTR